MAPLSPSPLTISVDGTPLPLVSTLHILGLFLQSNGKHTTLITQLSNTVHQTMPSYAALPTAITACASTTSAAWSRPLFSAASSILCLGPVPSHIYLHGSATVDGRPQLPYGADGGPSHGRAPPSLSHTPAIDPLPKNMIPNTTPPLEQRAPPLWRKFGQQPAVAYVDAAPYRHYAAHALAVTDTSSDLPLLPPSVLLPLSRLKRQLLPSP
ncbi:hypothetical protein HPB50_027652 [Hyalomma asiaticum]|nr:hypothetical protein HPB50_027652 [Hyalomma asiaticum]